MILVNIGSIGIYDLYITKDNKNNIYVADKMNVIATIKLDTSCSCYQNLSFVSDIGIANIKNNKNKNNK